MFQIKVCVVVGGSNKQDVHLGDKVFVSSVKPKVNVELEETYHSGCISSPIQVKFRCVVVYVFHLESETPVLNCQHNRKDVAVCVF